MSFLQELRRRSVFKVGGAYLVAAWIAIQAASILLPAFDAPSWSLRSFILLVLLGLPIALTLSWSLERTDDGLRVDRRGPGTKRLYAGAAALVVIAIVWYYVGQPAFHRARAAVDVQSIAVLPFVNMSGDAQNDYFSDGIAEEILNALAQMPELKVAARTSSFSFRSQAREIGDIARELGVRMVLEGSVRKQGQRVRITAQLIDAADGYHVWSRTFDRELQDVFAIQDEIAHAVASELQVKLGRQPGGSRVDVRDLEAYDAYLRGIAAFQARGRANLDLAEQQFRRAVARDPLYAKAWAGIAVVEAVRPDWFATSATEAYAQARDAAERALALDASLPEPYAALGNIAYGEARAATGHALFHHAIDIAPSYASAWQWYGWGLATFGSAAQAVAVSRRATELDPKSSIVRQDFARTLHYAGQDDAAEAECRRVVGDPAVRLACLGYMFDAQLARKDYRAARETARAMAAPRGQSSIALVDALMDAAEGKRDAAPLARQLLALPSGFFDDSSLSPLRDEEVFAWLMAVGRQDDAIALLGQIAARRAGGVIEAYNDPTLAPIRCRPEVLDVVADTGYPDASLRKACATADSALARAPISARAPQSAP